MITFSFTVARPSVTVKADGALPSGIIVLTDSPVVVKVLLSNASRAS